MHQFQKNNLVVKVFKTRSELGAAAAEEVKQKIVKVLEEKEHINIMFAAAPSQNEFLNELKQKNIEWFRINAFHMDEYVGLDKKAPQLFASYLNERLFNKVNLRSVHYINGNAKDIQEECDRYAGLLNLFPTDIVCLGIGENSHLAFNDPHVANFNDNETVKVVTLDEQSRLQQV
ncbi:MAG: 6-phosphogluconolactonase, partial [Flavisolibacter sp.]